MKKIYQAQLKQASTLKSESDKLLHLTSIIRSLLQTVAITSLEIIRELTPFTECDVDIDYYTQRLTHPSDGLPIEILDQAIPIIRSFVQADYMNGWFEKTEHPPFSKELLLWVEFRNKRSSHGVLDEKEINFWSTQINHLITRALIIFDDALPEADTLERLTLKEKNLTFDTPLVRNNHAIVIIEVFSRKGVWKLKGQILSWTAAKEFTIDLSNNNIFIPQRTSQLSRFLLKDIEHNNKKISLFHNIPIRQTNTFEGRKKELSTLKEWLEDSEDSRFCLIFGDGGFGKTTLALEFLNTLLDGDLETSAELPSIISFHTAKMTKWTDNGITHFKGISNAMEDCVRELMYCLYPVLGKDWYKIEGTALIDKAATELKEQGFCRDDILLVLDNTETLATAHHEIEELADFFKKVGKRIGRVIITSRRREFLPATPIQVSELPEEEALRLIKRLGSEYRATALNDAGDSRLKKVCKKLSSKPLLIDALVKYIARSNCSIDSALDQMLRKSNDELLEFLYEDAWQRMSESQKEVFLVVVSVACPLDGFAIGIACQEVGIQHAIFQSGLDETYFATQTSYENTYELEIVELARRFFLHKLSRTNDEEKEKIKLYARKVDQHAIEREKIEREYKSDRVADAFRSEYAKAAKIATDKGDLSEAIAMFNLAVQAEPLNAALHDRYAFFLLNRTNDIIQAKFYAEKATKYDSNSPDAHLTLALIHYKEGNIKSGDIAIELAKKNGKPESLCLLRMAIARYHFAKNQANPKEATTNIDDALVLLRRAQKIISPSEKYYKKNSNEIIKYQTMSQKLLHSLKSRPPIPLSSLIVKSQLDGFEPQ
ncbi:tetratricopeptide repeat protein [Pseudomonas protegens]|uniref:tetratricopeptide repeat protein n=1 Tax=Pseudomonas protegens TaxID=380021 RepID=UPI0022644D97|nr:hypothetical protein [Pseudomonas protegens]